MAGGGGSVEESIGQQGQMRTALAAGLDVVDLNQTVTFTLYKRTVLPADGFVFWVKADLLNPNQVLNAFPVNSPQVNQPPTVAEPAPTITARGSLHHTTINTQGEDESSSTNRMIFTSLDPINDLNEIGGDHLYLATTNGQRYAFSSRSGWYKQAALYHYSGNAVYPALASQIIDTPDNIVQREIVVSNSLPIWLSLNQLFPVYPSYLVPDNIRPPYGSIHIGENDTTPLQAAPRHDWQGSRWQLTKDIVRVTTYGVRNSVIMDWLDLVQDYALYNPDVMGIMNSPVPRDAKRGQVEISAIAQKKEITFEVNYYQLRIRALARQLITEALFEEFLFPTNVN